MPALAFARPQRLHTPQLLAELRAAGIDAGAAVVEGDALVVYAPEGTSRAAVAAVLAAHVPPPERRPRPDADVIADVTLPADALARLVVHLARRDPGVLAALGQDVELDEDVPA